MDLQRGINDMGKYNSIKGTPSDFPMFYDAGVRGLTDIDQVYEKNSEFIFTEGKRIFANMCDVPISQTITLSHLANKLGSKSRVLIVAYKEVAPDTFIYYMCGIKQFVTHAIPTVKVVKNHTIKIMRCDVEHMVGPMGKKEYTNKIKEMCDKLE